jgi:hypothetical protein
MGATGGQGGNALLKDESSNLIANGANGGSIEFDGGNGGNGFNACTRPNLGVGVGGVGGSAEGTSGAGGASGTGRANGLAGAGTLNGTLNGGSGGTGLQPGHAGFAGFNGATARGPFAVAAASLNNGVVGAACTLAFTATFTPVDSINRPSTANDNLYWHLAGTRTVSFQPGPVVTGQLGADGTYAQVINVVNQALNGEFYLGQPGAWDGRTVNMVIIGGTATVDLGGIFTFPNTASGVHFVGTLILSGTSAGSPPVSAPAQYTVVMDGTP